MRKSSLLAIALGTAGVVAVTAGCSTSTQQSVIGTGSTGWTVAAQPQDEGQALLTAINNAQTSVDIVVYQIGDDQITTALVNAMKRGVQVRLVLDGYSKYNASSNQEAAQAIYQAAVAAGIDNPPFSANYSSDNFNITHQKTAVIDANGETPTAVISTGNFSGFKGTPFYHARDFYITTQDANLVGQISNVFNSDFRCDDRFQTNGLLDSNPLIWSNGTTQLNQGDPAGAYPLRTPTADQPNFGYFYFDKQNPPKGQSSPEPVVQGGSMAAQRAIIQAAQSGDVLRIYNEEQNSYEINQDLAAAVGRGVDVRIVESYEDPADSKKVPNLIALATTAPNGARANVMAPDSVDGSIYIHAKVVSLQPANGTMQAYVGSSNFSDPSMEDNRELGAILGDNDQDQISQINQVFDQDFGNDNPKLAYMITMQNKGTGIPSSWNDAVTATEDPDVQLTYGPPTPNVSACGPIPGVGPSASPTPTPSQSSATSSPTASPTSSAPTPDVSILSSGSPKVRQTQ